ncbi:hypothetical protein BJY01DRAFT_248092 [Aspergillus pseudoustus]|uniref:Isoprenoid synthase domain-containing protein n=1 Tax=Aspergillus pseudoustus TaxID=1810923 RepID=A0ABR4JX08_9EURO
MAQPLRDLIAANQFFTLEWEPLLRCIHDAFPSELERLKSAYSIPAPGKKPKPAAPPPHDHHRHGVSHVSHQNQSQNQSENQNGNEGENQSPSQILFGRSYDEVDRTLVSIDALRMIHNDEYARFAATQDGGVRMQRDSFDWIRKLYREVITGSNEESDSGFDPLELRPEPEMLYTLVTSVIINDLGKSAGLEADLKKEVGGGDGDGEDDVEHVNHDLLIHQVIQRAPQLIPCLDSLAPSHRADLELGIELGAYFNFGQLAQAENVPASLVGLDCVRGKMAAFELRFVEQILDIAGSAGHEDHGHAKKLTEPIFRSYRLVYDLARRYINGEVDKRGAYDENLRRRLNALVQEGRWEGREDLDIAIPEHRALMRLLCICNANTAKSAELVEETFHHYISSDTRRILVRGLNLDGSVDNPAVQATYIPAVCSTAITAAKSHPQGDPRQALGAQSLNVISEN